MSSVQQRNPTTSDDLFTRADWYDRTIDWSARLRREVPVLVEVLGPPGEGGILDAGCGTGHQACALAQRGYRVVAADASEEMLEIARHRTPPALRDVRFVAAPYAALYEKAGGGFDGVYCLGNALAAAGTRAAVSDALGQFARCLRLGGRLLLQLINFPLMRSEDPCVRGPRVSKVDGVEYVSVRHFVFADASVRVTNITLWHDGGWEYRTHTGTLYPVSLDELHRWCAASGLRIDETWGGYSREAFDSDHSTDLLIVATRV
jgi:SAM-dependent methyltransferase